MATVELVLGGVRCGKSEYAQRQAANSGKPVVYIATANPKTQQMQQRITRHQQTRPSAWQTIEEAVNLAQIIADPTHSGSCLLVDCLTLWLSNIMFGPAGNLQPALLRQQTTALYQALPEYRGNIILVSNELGLGGVLPNKAGRQFADEAGLLHQRLAAISQRVVLITAGLVQVLK